MDLDKIRQLIEAMAKSDLAHLEVIEDGWTLRLSRDVRSTANRPTTAQPGAIATKAFAPTIALSAPQATAATNEIRAPLSGVVYLRPHPDKPPFVAAGETIKAGMPVCMVEAMKVFNEVRADRDGVVEAVLVADGKEVDSGEPLVRLARRPA